MAQMGLSLGYAVVMALNFVIVAGWLVLGILALHSLRRRRLPPTAQAIWVLLIVVIPLLGALAFWVVQPGAEDGVAKER